MLRALELAELGRYSTTPNPHVGCVIVDSQQKIVGEGYHQKAGEAHAEINALNQAKDLAIDASAYVTLEPCAHTNRTGPCAVALVKSGIKRVVIACTDPNPKVAGKGIGILRDAGIQVDVGLCEDKALHLNRAFFCRMIHQRPFITVKLAASLDGKTALADGQSKWITGPLARKDVQQLRAQSCAILSGADTVIADDPRLNVRQLEDSVAELFARRAAQPLRVIIDSKNRLNETYGLFNDGHPVLVYNGQDNDNFHSPHIMQSHIEPSSTDDGYLSLQAVMKDLAKREVNHLWVEAGAKLTGALFNANLVDELILYQAPKLLGQEARGLTNVQSPALLEQVKTGRITDVRLIGDDSRTILCFEHNK